MKVLIRVDASVKIGIGHLVRSLALANELKVQGFNILFACSPDIGQESGRIIKDGHQLIILSNLSIKNESQYKLKEKLNNNKHHRYQWSFDLEQTKEHLRGEVFDWLIVDHYSLDYRWENGMRNHAKKIMVIDDLGNRKHACDLLLDQTYGRKQQDYIQWTPKNCILLTGAKFALLRPEFNKLRNRSLQRRMEPEIKHILISMGGTDQFNTTEEVLQVMQTSSLPLNFRITVLMGKSSPWIESVCNLSKKLLWKIDVKVDAYNVAELMVDCDLAIGAAGSSAWERCCLGLPSIMLVLADNQKDIAQSLHDAKAVILVKNTAEIKYSIKQLIDEPKKLVMLSKESSDITDGKGIQYVSNYISDVSV